MFSIFHSTSKPTLRIVFMFNYPSSAIQLTKKKKEVPAGLDMRECYGRLYRWFGNSKNQDILIEHNMKMSRELWELRKIIHSRTNAQLDFLKKLPSPDSIGIEDLLFVCKHVINGHMQWANHEKDEHGIEMSSYASHILSHFSDGLDGQETRNRVERSKMRLELEREERQQEARRKSACFLDMN